MALPPVCWEKLPSIPRYRRGKQVADTEKLGRKKLNQIKIYKKKINIIIYFVLKYKHCLKKMVCIFPIGGS